MRLLLLIPIVFIAACFANECDENQVYENGGCQVVPPDAGVTPDATDTDGGDVLRLGTSCTATGNECGGDADYCAIEPGKPAGICTRTGCKEDPSVCPEGWDCTDLSVFLPSLPSICVPGATP